MPEVSVRGRRLGYEVQPVNFDKSNLSVVFVHGSGGDREDWRAQLDGLSHAANVIALELPGHGQSDGPGETSVPAFSRWVIDFVEALALEKVVLVGCSLGSAIVQWIALFEKPAWLKGIGLVGAGARLRVHPAILAGLAENQNAALERLADFCLSPASDGDLHKKVEEKYSKTSAELVHADLSACDAFDVIDKVKDIALPTMIVVGQDDMLTPVKYAKFLNEAIQGSTLTILPRAGHLVMMEQPEQFNATLRGFLAQLRG